MHQQLLLKVRWKLWSSLQHQQQKYNSEKIFESLWIQGPQTENIIQDEHYVNLCFHNPWAQSPRDTGCCPSDDVTSPMMEPQSPVNVATLINRSPAMRALKISPRHQGKWSGWISTNRQILICKAQKTSNLWRNTFFLNPHLQNIKRRVVSDTYSLRTRYAQARSKDRSKAGREEDLFTYIFPSFLFPRRIRMIWGKKYNYHCECDKAC